MGLQMHVFRRGATYVWRRRLPVAAGGQLMQVSLRTNDPLIARRVATIVSAESYGIFDAMTRNRLSREEARTLLEAAITRALGQIEVIRMNIPDSPAVNAWRDNLSEDWAMGKAYEIVSHRGAAAAPLQDSDRHDMRAEGRTEGEIERCQANVGVLVQGFEAPIKEGPNAPAYRLMKEALGRNDFSQAEMNHGRRVVFRGRGAAFLVASMGHLSSLDRAKKEALSLAEGDEKEDLVKVPIAYEAAPVLAPTPSVISSSLPPVAEDEPVYDPSFPALVARLMAQKQKRGVSAQMIDQMSKVFMLFGEATGVNDIRQLRQAHLARFVEVLGNLPASYRKSPKDRHKTLEQILSEAAARTQTAGLSSTTINRNLDYLGQLFTKAKSEGHLNVAMLDLNSLRIRKTKRDRDERPAFTRENVQAIFRHPVWQGSQGGYKWQEDGNIIEKNGFYWVPIIAAFTGARREEISALKASDIEIIEGIPVLHIRPNSNRGVKNLTSERTVPLHPQLIDLGLLAHAQAQARGHRSDIDLFPDLRPATMPGKFGEKIDYKFRQLVKRQLKQGAERKVFHSFRHYVTTQLGREKDVRSRVQKDIVGHVGDSITEERYSETATIPEMLAAISRLPYLPIDR